MRCGRAGWPREEDRGIVQPGLVDWPGWMVREQAAGHARGTLLPIWPSNSPELRRDTAYHTCRHRITPRCRPSYDILRLHPYHRTYTTTMYAFVPQHAFATCLPP